MTLLRCLLACGVVATAVVPASAFMMPPPPAPSAADAALAAKCKAASFARRPAGQMATTMREFQINRCIKNKGFLD